MDVPVASSAPSPLMSIPVVHPSPVLRQTLLEKYRSAGESPKKVQFDFEEEDHNQKEKTPQRKGKPRYSFRDSMKIRYRTGKPGSRRHQRWSNEMYLGYDWSDISESEVEEDIFETFQEIHERPHFSFTKTFNENASTLEEFWYAAQWEDDIASSAESSNTLSSQCEKKLADPEYRFRQIPRKSRVHLEKFSTSRFVVDLEEELHNYVVFLSNPSGSTRLNNTYHSPSTSFNASMQNGALVFYFQDSLARLMAHGLCKYYSLDSQSWNDENSLRATTIKSFTSDVPLLPEISLGDYIASQADSAEED